MTKTYRFRNQEMAIAKLSTPISQFGMNGTFSTRTDVTVIGSYKRCIRGKNIVYYTVKINNAALHSIFGPTVEVADTNDNLRKVKSKRTRYLTSFK